MQLSDPVLAAQVGCGRLAFSSGSCWLNVSYGQSYPVTLRDVYIYWDIANNLTIIERLFEDGL